MEHHEAKYVTDDLKKKLDKSGNPYKLLYEWVKTSHVSYRVFMVLNKHLVEKDLKEIGR
jgi:hypothetical protein